VKYNCSKVSHKIFSLNYSMKFNIQKPHDDLHDFKISIYSINTIIKKSTFQNHQMIITLFFLNHWWHAPQPKAKYPLIGHVYWKKGKNRTTHTLLTRFLSLNSVRSPSADPVRPSLSHRPSPIPHPPGPRLPLSTRQAAPPVHPHSRCEANLRRPSSSNPVSPKSRRRRSDWACSRVTQR
jgi:hypothetical protein